MTICLSPKELKELTGHVRSDAQVKELCHMGIEHKIRRDGTVAVSRDHYEAVMSGVPANKRKAQNDDKVNWEAARA
ncbi:DUF4224 domain-containing protein [Methylophilus flavus]|uniref:DUF4224 domain-containing protein n=1 Tax=Methylophilus flavus TaxID=640084 RepID=A0ABW3PBR5_9PROT